MYLMIDNYDSFTHNLYALLKKNGAKNIKIVKNDDPVENISNLKGIILSPGPSSPQNAGNMSKYLEKYKGKIPFLGVCLGMQAIGEFLGYKVKKALSVMHGKKEKINTRDDSMLFNDITSGFEAVRYHSLAVNIENNNEFVTSIAESDSEIMSIEDKDNLMFGVQFHPESILSKNGDIIVENFLRFCENKFNKVENVNSKKILDKIIKQKQSLSYAESLNLFENIVHGRLSEVEITAILLGLKLKKESADEILGAVDILNKNKIPFDKQGFEVIDTCGTGGDGKNCMNVSTAVSIVLSSLGFKVVKHGNNAQSGKIGSADIIKNMGIPLAKNNLKDTRNFLKNDYIFLYAPKYHPILKNVGKIRKQLSLPTIFNLLGPLLNPANPDYQIIGVGNKAYLAILAEVLSKDMKGRKKVIIYSSFDGYDEVSTNAKTKCYEINEKGEISQFTICPSDFFRKNPMPIVKDNDEAELMFLRSLSGSSPALTNLIAINTALALKCNGSFPDMKKGFKHVVKHLKEGKVLKKLNSLKIK